MAIHPFTGVPSLPKEWSPQKETSLGLNAVRSYQSATPALAAHGRQFFPTWQEDAERIGSEIGGTVEHGATILARLSPSTEADVNRMMGHQLLTLDERQTAHIHKAAEISTVRAKINSKKNKTLQDKQLIDSLDAQVDAHRSAAGIVGTPLGMQDARAISKALRIRDEQPQNPLSTLDTPKIGDFGPAIATGGRTTRKTIDTHYHDAMVGRTDIPYALDRGLSSIGRYEGMSRAADRGYDFAVRRGIIEPSPTSHQDFMAVGWTAQQQRKIETNPNARKARKATNTRTANLVAASGGRWDPAEFGLRPIQTGLIV